MSGVLNQILVPGSGGAGGLSQAEVDARVEVVSDDLIRLPMRQYDGVNDYAALTGLWTPAANVVTAFGTFKVEPFTGGGQMRINSARGPNNRVRPDVVISASDHATTGRRNKLHAVVANAANTLLYLLFSDVEVADGEQHSYWAAFDADNGTGILWVDGVDADDTGNGERVAPTVGTIDTGASSEYGLGASPTGNDNSKGEIGVACFTEAYLTNVTDVFDGAYLKDIDWEGWTELGGQPEFLTLYGDGADHLGSFAALTVNGAPRLWLPGMAGLQGLPL